MKYITVKRFAELSGFSENAIRGKIQRGDWLENRVWKHTPTGGLVIMLEGYYRWVEGSTGGAA